jgi:hypothetical protein
MAKKIGPGSGLKNYRGQGGEKNENTQGENSIKLECPLLAESSRSNSISYDVPGRSL